MTITGEKKYLLKDNHLIVTAVSFISAINHIFRHESQKILLTNLKFGHKNITCYH